MLTTPSFSTLLPLSFLDISSSPPPFIPLTISPVLGCLFPGLSWHCWRSPGIPLQALHLLSRNNFLAKVSHPRDLNCNQSPNTSRISRFSPDPCSDLQTPGPVQGLLDIPRGHHSEISNRTCPRLPLLPTRRQKSVYNCMILFLLTTSFPP